MTNKQIAEQIQTQFNLVEMAKELGVEVHKNGRYYQSKSFIDPGNNDRVVTYNFDGSNLWHDFKTNETGDVIKLYAYLKCGGDLKHAFKELMERCHINSKNLNNLPDNELIQDKEDFLNRINLWHQSLKPEHREYLHKRGITDATINTLKIGYNTYQHRIMIPYYLEEDRNHQSPVYACGRLFDQDFTDKTENSLPKYTKLSLNKNKFKIDQETGEKVPIKNKYLKNVIWGLDTLSRKKDNILIICEGAFDALSFWQEGYAVISPLTTSFNAQQKEEITKILPRFHEVMIILDNDEAGKKNAETLAEICFNNHIEFSLSFVKEKESFITKEGKTLEKEELKDVSDFYANSIACLDLFSEMNENEERENCPEILQPLIDRRFNGLTYLCQNKTNLYRNYGKRFDEIEKIISIASRYYPDRYVRNPIIYFKRQLEIYKLSLEEKSSNENLIAELENKKRKEENEKKIAKLTEQINYEIQELDELKTRIKELERKILNEEDIRNLKYLAQNGPRDNVIIEEIMKHYLLLFDPGLGFFEFNGMIWKNRDDLYILNIIGSYLGKFNKSRHSLDILKALQAKCYKNVEFNTKEQIAFKNGILNLNEDKPLIKKGNPEDYLTLQLNFNYDENAQCPKWHQFIEDISGGNKNRAQLLKETGGYILFSGSPLHKCIYLKGTGSNGKSLFLNMMINVFGAENTVNVPLSELDNEFKRIGFRTSLLNVSPDDPGDLPKSTRGIFKNLVTADPIDGSRKYKDTVSFRPRSKLLIASEHLPKTKDIGDGMDRRFLFIEFPIKFVLNPNENNPNEKLIDPDLEEKLIKEIPGIFNFFYDGYKVLKEQKHFTQTKEEVALHKRFKKKNNIVFAFLEEVDLTSQNSISNSEAYRKFITWYTKVYQEAPKLSQMSFSRDFRREFLKLHPDYLEYNTSGSRGVRKKELQNLNFIKS